MNKKISLGVTISLLLLAVAIAVSGTMMLAMRHFSVLVSDVGQRQAMYDYIDEIDSAARQHYTIDEEKLRAALAKGYINGLEDAYAQYLSADAYQEVKSKEAGNRTGFGLKITVSDNRIIVASVDENSPAALAGIKKGAVITKLQEEAVTGTSFATVESALGSQEKVLLTVEDAGQSNTTELTANTYSVVSVYGELLQDAVGYIRIDEFNALTALQFKNAFNKLMQEGASYLVFDLRNNAGGQLSAATEMLDYLLPRGPYISCEKKGKRTVLTATDTYEMTFPTATLVNGNTVGEAELFAAVLQDFKKTNVVGTSTQGKAVMQEYFSMASDKGAVRLSTGTFYCIQSEETWQNTGVYPNKTTDLPYELQSRFDLITKEEDTQLQAAITLLKNSHYVSLNNATTAGAATTTNAQAATTASQKK